MVVQSYLRRFTRFLSIWHVDFRRTTGTNPNLPTMARVICRYYENLQNRFLIVLIACCAKPMRFFGRLYFRLQRVHECPRNYFLKFISLLFSIPSFKASNFFFKKAYALQQRRLRNLCSEDFFLQFYDRPVPDSSVADVLETLRHIKHGLEGADAAIYFAYHDQRSQQLTKEM